MKSSEVLQAALERMDGGKMWTQKGWFWELLDGQTLSSPTRERKCCSVGALIDLGDNLDARCFLIKAISPAIVDRLERLCC